MAGRLILPCLLAYFWAVVTAIYWAPPITTEPDALVKRQTEGASEAQVTGIGTVWDYTFGNCKYSLQQN